MEKIVVQSYSFKIPVSDFKEWYETVYDCGDTGDIIEWKEKIEGIKGHIGTRLAVFGFHYFLFLTKKGRDEGARLAKEYGIKHIVKLDTPEWIDARRIIEARRGYQNGC